MIENVDVINSNARSSMTYYINDTISFATIIILKSLFEFENFLKKESDTKMTEKNSKKEEESFEKTIEKRTDKSISFLYLIFL